MTGEANAEPGDAVARVRVHAAATYAGLKHVFDAYQRFVERARVPDAARHDMYVALEEIVSNVIRHGVTPGIRPRLTIALRYDSRVFRATIIDSGVAFNPLTAPSPDVSEMLADRPIGGLGILFVRRLMDGVQYRHANGRNHVRLRKDTGRV